MHTWLRWCVVDWGFGLVWFGLVVVVVFILFCFVFLIFETGFLCMDLAILEITLRTRLALNSEI